MRRSGSANPVQGTALRGKRLAVVVTAVMLAIFLVPATAQSAAGPTRVLITGDSVTSGWVGDYTWRYHFSTARPDLDLVGNKTGTTAWGDWDYNGADAYADPNFDTGHAATFGGNLSEQNPQEQWKQLPINVLTESYKPDVVIGFWGVNDLFSGVTPADLVGHYSRWISDARAVQPGVDFIIAKLPQTWHQGAPEFNAMLDGLAADTTTPTSRVVIASDTFDKASEFKDNSHPNAQGEEKIAAMMQTAYTEIERLTAGDPPTMTPTTDVPPPASTPPPVTPIVAVLAPTSPAPTTVKLGVPRKVMAVRRDARVTVTWRRSPAALSYAVRCGTTTTKVTGAKAVLRTRSASCKVRAVSGARSGNWVTTMVRVPR